MTDSSLCFLQLRVGFRGIYSFGDSYKDQRDVIVLPSCCHFLRPSCLSLSAVGYKFISTVPRQNPFPFEKVTQFLEYVSGPL